MRHSHTTSDWCRKFVGNLSSQSLSRLGDMRAHIRTAKRKNMVERKKDFSGKVLFALMSG